MKNRFVVETPSYPGDTTEYAFDPSKLLHAIVDVICVFDSSCIFRYISPSSLNVFGYEPAEMLHRLCTDFIHHEDKTKTLGILTRHSIDGQTFNFENRYIRKDGGVVHVKWSGRWDEQDQLLYCVARDGSDTFNAEQRLLKAQRIARVANYEFDVVGNRYTYVSDTIFEIFGLDREIYPAFTSELFWTLVHPDDLAMVRESVALREALTNPSLEYRIVQPGGRVVYINRLREVICDSEGQAVKTIGTLQDVTDRRLSEMAVQQSEVRLRALVQNGHDMVGIIDPQGVYRFVSNNVKQHLGFDAADMTGKSAFSFIYDEDQETVASYLQRANENERVEVPPFRFVNSKGEWRWVECTVSNHVSNPAINGLVVNAKDITERKVKDDELRLSEQRFKALVKNGSDLIIIIDKAGNLRYVSCNSMAVLGYEKAELTGKNALEFIHPNDQQKVATEIEAVMRGDGTAKGVLHRFLHKDGHWVWLESKGTDHHLTQSIQGILVNARNITERVRLQRKLNKELINKQKEITSAVIRTQESERSQLGLELHDNVNQILTTVKLYNEMYLTGYVQDKELLAKSAQYTQDCINEIRSISKRLSAPTLGRISLQDSIRELVDSINLTRRLEIIYMPQGIAHCCVSNDLHLAIYRIVQEGLNNILKYSQATVACIEIKRQSERLQLVISDNGQGFDTSTKRAGIGLTNMKTRAENQRGEFRLKSAPGKGCEIEICFPYEEPAVNEKEEPFFPS